jgi:hypothetical protein
MVMNQKNGTLLEALITWKSKAGKKFDSVKECPICYSLIHHAN